MHYDLRLELDGTMKSWAVPKGPSLDPADKRMAAHVEDHPLAYNTFEGQIPEKQYGAGKVIVWDKGFWEPSGNPSKAYRAGKLKFRLRGHKLTGAWALVRMRARQEMREAWLLIKERDAKARPASEYRVVDEMPESVAGLKQPTTPASVLARAVKRAPPATLSPELATLVDRPPSATGNWAFEIKFDG